MRGKPEGRGTGLACSAACGSPETGLLLRDSPPTVHPGWGVRQQSLVPGFLGIHRTELFNLEHPFLWHSVLSQMTSSLLFVSHVTSVSQGRFIEAWLTMQETIELWPKHRGDRNKSQEAIGAMEPTVQLRKQGICPGNPQGLICPMGVGAYPLCPSSPGLGRKLTELWGWKQPQDSRFLPISHCWSVASAWAVLHKRGPKTPHQNPMTAVWQPWAVKERWIVFHHHIPISSP